MAKKDKELGDKAIQTPREGDLYYDLVDGKFYVYQILRIDSFANGEQIHHLKSYHPLDREPVEADIDGLEVFVWHSPFEPQLKSRYLGHRDLVPEDLEGFHVYLKMTDFKRYIKETRQDVDAVIKRAKQHFNEGNRLAEAGEFEEAMGWYDKAIDEFPYFYEAIDNKAFTLMDLARWNEAISCFEDSLKVEPRNVAAVFSIGECLFKLGEFEGAAARFRAALEIEPGHALSSEWLAKAEAAIDNPAGSGNKR
ncbi:MAG: tetratricopeptide repeat protein [Candidatus Lokiarchaeota archaeon]|nr:tetratricopeptide repeat protein [Candidatus Lokiarchaeota archaeon]